MMIQTMEFLQPINYHAHVNSDGKVSKSNFACLYTWVMKLVSYTCLLHCDQFFETRMHK
jgi:hypothetical protein